MVTIFPATEAIVEDNERNEKEPGLFEVGFVNTNDTSENNFCGILKFDKVGVITFTVNGTVIDAVV